MKILKLIGTSTLLIALVMFSSGKAQAEGLLPTEKVIMQKFAPHLVNSTDWTRTGSGSDRYLHLTLPNGYSFLFHVNSISDAYIVMTYLDLAEYSWRYTNGEWDDEPRVRPLKPFLEQHCPDWTDLLGY